MVANETVLYLTMCEKSIDSALKWQEKVNKVFSKIENTSQKLLPANRLELDTSSSTQLPSTRLPDKRVALFQHKPELEQPLMESNKFRTDVKTITRSCQTSPALYPTQTRGSRTEAVHYLNLSWKSSLNDIVKLLCNGNIKKANTPECADKPHDNLSPAYRFNLDNLDFHLKVRDMTQDHQNMLKHYVQLMAVKDRVNCEHLPDTLQIGNLVDVANNEFLPNADDISSLREDIINLTATLLVNHLECF
ncbi:Hypothetical predicted protein [Mytilus galloprovincialis]|uniref:Uncharacterized protein n=1 Tax=Mytilus galloprovincialis TaxID=29158 RepID=A0A8B6GHL1_MYTGA|nr:Hypothetical predicted protein [Mytilus galloprovincialis]